MSDFLHKGENGTYILGNDHLTATGITIANEEELFATALETVSVHAKDMKNQYSNLEEYKTAMSEAIYENQMKKFEGTLGEKALATEMMRQQIEKNATAQAFIGHLDSLGDES
ncbi:MAG: hypothetical protein LBH96_06605 [Candidatus Peribacteria bacterium]|nr:hypothetical protein [Candidatus Peribacteria bacterium]